MPNHRLSWTLTGDPNQPGPGIVRSMTVNEIDMVFQPIVDVRTGALFAHEALVRCKLPQYASPLVLFAAAETEHATGYLGNLIRRRTFELCPDVALFVNVHPEELSQRWLVRPDDPLYFHERELYLEITESAAFTHYDLCMSVLKDVCTRAGVHLVVDDYGAGHSNLARILDLNPEIVKLDGALIHGIDRDPRRQAMVRHMVSLCAELGAKVVAECVETADELKAVVDQGVHYAQGYVLARPAFPPPEFAFPFPRGEGATPSARQRPPPRPGVPPLAVDSSAIPPTSTRLGVMSKPQPKTPSKIPTAMSAKTPAKVPSKIPPKTPVAAPGKVPGKAPSKFPPKKPSKGPSKPPSRRPTPPALPKRPPPLPGTR